MDFTVFVFSAPPPGWIDFHFSKLYVTGVAAPKSAPTVERRHDAQGRHAAIIHPGRALVLLLAVAGSGWALRRHAGSRYRTSCSERYAHLARLVSQQEHCGTPFLEAPVKGMPGGGSVSHRTSRSATGCQSPPGQSHRPRRRSSVVGRVFSAAV